MSKIDEVNEFIIRNEINLALITETWLKESVLTVSLIFQISPYCAGIEHRRIMEGCVPILENHNININVWTT